MSLLDYVEIVLGLSTIALVSILVNLAIWKYIGTPPDYYPAVAGFVGSVLMLGLAARINKRRRQRVK